MCLAGVDDVCFVYTESKSWLRRVSLSYASTVGQWSRWLPLALVVMDEPTSAIDALAEGRIFDHLFGKARHKTVITISHRLSTVEKADQIIVFEDGQIVEQGTHAELVAKKGAYVKLFRRQLKQ